MNVSRGVHNRSIFVLIPTPSQLRVTVVQRRQQNRKKSKIHTFYLVYTIQLGFITVQWIRQRLCAVAGEVRRGWGSSSMINTILRHFPMSKKFVLRKISIFVDFWIDFLKSTDSKSMQIQVWSLILKVPQNENWKKIDRKNEKKIKHFFWALESV